MSKYWNLLKNGKTQAIEELKPANNNELEPNTNHSNNELNSINLSDLKPSNGFVINGIEETKWELLGSVSNAGDVNGDGIEDIVLSTPDTYINDLKRVGQSYVIFGKQNIASNGNFDLNQLDGSNGFIIEGLDAYDRLGWSISSAGDVNGDGIEDIVIGVPSAEHLGKTFAGESYIIFGNAEIGSSGSLQLSELDGNNGFVLKGIDLTQSSENSVGFFGFAVSSGGDVNGDGIDDIVVGAPGSSFEGKDVGRSYVIFGDADLGSSGSIELSALDGSNGFAVICLDESPGCDTAVSNAGDVNGDGIDDIVIGAKYSDESYVIFGNTSLGSSGNFELSTLNGSNGFIIQGMDEGDFFGRSVTSAGDVNGDGIDDIAIGATLAAPDSKRRAGETYVIFGNPEIGSAGSIELSTLNGNNGFIVSGMDAGDLLGHSVTNAGDINSDGIDDIVIAAAGGDFNLDSSTNQEPLYNVHGGEAYLIFGSTELGSDGSIELSSLNSTQGLILKNYGNHIISIADGGIDISINNAVSSAGDINGDGIEELIIGVPGGSNEADSYVIFGSSDNIIRSLDSNNNHPKQITNSNSLFEGQSLVVALFICLNLLSMLVIKRIYLC